MNRTLFKLYIIYGMIKKIISLDNKRKLANSFNEFLFNNAMKSYSQEGEDMILRRIFVNSNSGFYVDVGAFHPTRFSNTYLFYKNFHLYKTFQFLFHLIIFETDIYHNHLVLLSLNQVS